MSPNKAKRHVLVLPEDDANSRLATGFHLEVDSTRYRQMQVLAEADGWMSVLETFKSEHVMEMERCPNRFMVLLIDFDRDAARLEEAKGAIPEHLSDRVFVVGAWSEPEDLKADLGNYENIGSLLAKDCREETDDTWGHPLLQHNASELARLRQQVRSILF